MVHRGLAVLQVGGGRWTQIGASTHGKSDRTASVMPKPARKIGAKPIRGLIRVPSNAATGDFYDEISTARCEYMSTMNVRR